MSMWMRSMLSRFCAQQNSWKTFIRAEVPQPQINQITVEDGDNDICPGKHCSSWILLVLTYLHFLTRCWGSIFSSWSCIMCWFIVPTKFSLKIYKLLGNGRPHKCFFVAIVKKARISTTTYYTIYIEHKQGKQIEMMLSMNKKSLPWIQAQNPLTVKNEWV